MSLIDSFSEAVKTMNYQVTQLPGIGETSSQSNTSKSYSILAHMNLQLNNPQGNLLFKNKCSPCHGLQIANNFDEAIVMDCWKSMLQRRCSRCCCVSIGSCLDDPVACKSMWSRALRKCNCSQFWKASYWITPPLAYLALVSEIQEMLKRRATCTGDWDDLDSKGHN